MKVAIGTQHSFQAALLCSLTLLSACADIAVAPHPPGTARSTLSEENGSLLIAWDESGNSFSLNAAAREITFSDGRVIIMNDEQTAHSLADFEATINDDRLGAVIDVHNWAADCGEGPCEEPMRPEFAPDIRRIASSPSKRVGPGKVGVRILSVGSEQRSLASAITINESVTSSYYEWPQNCLSMKEDLIRQVALFRDSRRSGLDAWWSAARSSFVFEMGRAVFRVAAPGISFGAFIVQGQVSKKAAHVQLDVMRSVYNAGGCGSINFPEFGVTSGTIGGFGRSCHFENWIVSFNNGEVERHIQVEVCEFTQA